MFSTYQVGKCQTDQKRKLVKDSNKHTLRPVVEQLFKGVWVGQGCWNKQINHKINKKYTVSNQLLIAVHLLPCFTELHPEPAEHLHQRSKRPKTVVFAISLKSRGRTFVRAAFRRIAALQSPYFKTIDR